LYQWHFSVPISVSLETYGSQFVSHTSDMGIEFSLPGFEMDTVDDILPPWIQRDDLHLDVGEAGPPDLGRPKHSCRLMGPEALPIYGLQHAINNINVDVRTCLSYWDSFWDQLKNFEGLLNVGERRRRFVWTCVKGSPLADQSHKLNKWSAELYEKRWRCVLAFLKHLAPLLNIFRVCWDERMFASQVDDRW
jgi:hypothetical protein